MKASLSSYFPRSLVFLRAYNVHVRCALQNEPGTAKFLLHESLKRYVTDDHYACFSEHEAEERLHAIVSCLIHSEFIEMDDSPILLSGGEEQYTFAPEATRHRVGHIGEYYLRPDEEFMIRCPRGVIGSAIVRALEADGNKR